MQAAASAAVTRLPYYYEATFAPHWYSAGQAPPDTLHTVGRFHFTDQQGQAVTNGTLAERIYLANFFFTECPGICPRMNEHVRQVLAHFARHPNVLAVSHSVLPARDSVPALHAYAQAHHIDCRSWHLVTGPQAGIYAAAQQRYFADQPSLLSPTASLARFLHTEHILLVDRTGHLRGLYNGTLAVDVGRMEEDITLLLQEQPAP